jgi:hypothetical protein
MVRESGCAKDRAGVASQRGDTPSSDDPHDALKARTGEKAEPAVASSGPAALLSKLLAERNTSLCVLRHTRCNDPFWQMRQRPRPDTPSDVLTHRSRLGGIARGRKSLPNGFQQLGAGSGGGHLAVTLSANAVEKLF